MINKPLVTIVSLLYDIKKEYVNECIKSLLNQSYKNLEIIFIDDCSPTINYDYITSISPKIKLVKNEKNLGMNKTAQKVFNMAHGKYVVRIDSDDIISRSLIEKEVNVLERNPNVGAVCCDLMRFGKRRQHIKRPKIWNLKKILDGDFHGAGYAGGMMFRTSLLPYVKINEEYKMCEDFDFHLQLLEHMPIRSINEPLYHYRCHVDSLCSQVSSKVRIGINDKILSEHRKIYKKLFPSIEDMDFVYIIKPGDDGQDLKYSLRSIAKYYPNNKVWIAGYKPENITNVNYLPIEQSDTKWKNSTNNVIQICQCKDISDNFILMNDDFFAIKPTIKLEDIIDSNIGYLDRYIERYRYDKGEWENGFRNVSNLLSELKVPKPYYCFEGHLPIKINKEKFLKVINFPEVKEFMKTPKVLFKRTLYKQFDKPNKSIILPLDVKITADNDISKKIMKICGWLSIADNLIGNKKFKDLNQIIDTNLSKPCKYEK